MDQIAPAALQIIEHDICRATEGYVYAMDTHCATLQVKNHITAFPCGCLVPLSEFAYQIRMRFRGGAGRPL
ncbi:hypothetical protein NUKP104_44210 [Klebsiella variicola]|nr:hypothetical protein NUKP42_41610 [Klebsiella variicola]GKL40886.1 hypothetical protein NUKP55_41870 [Klebsiella variicola]GKO10068.1 hypothetical protein NUKP99_40350 [Klebsiella variicola]GKO33519.1 hypothetical protein NUKP104_44210 [Klebsiella variicola]